MESVAQVVGQRTQDHKVMSSSSEFSSFVWHSHCKQLGMDYFLKCKIQSNEDELSKTCHFYTYRNLCLLIQGQGETIK